MTNTDYRASVEKKRYNEAGEALVVLLVERSEG